MTKENVNGAQRPVMIVDSYNAFLRSYAAYPTMSSHGYQMGGTIGYLKTLGRIVGDFYPRAVYIVWEGGGSRKRRAIYSGYKMNRKPGKLNRFYEDDLPDTEHNKQHQVIKLLAFLKCIPVCQLYVADCEGDDVIAHLCKSTFKDDQKIIVSSDKDMYQLLDDKTRVYNLHKKVFKTAQNVFEEFKVTTTNFAIAKSLCGDQSDNIPGVKGIGFKRVAKLFPQLGLEEPVILNDVISYAHSHVDEGKAYKNVVEAESDVKRNYRLIKLSDTSLSISQANKIEHAISTFTPSSDKVAFIKLLVEEGIGDFDVESLMYSFKGIDFRKDK